jgi:phosphate transport system permease protein
MYGNGAEERSGRKRTERLKWAGIVSIVAPLAILALLVVTVFVQGLGWMSWDFFVNLTSETPARAGILPAMVGSVLLIVTTALVAVPIGVGAAVYLEEFADDGWFASLVEINIANLAGVPSVIFGILGLTVFVNFARLGSTIIAGALTLALLILPVIIMAAREALRSVPNDLREAALGLGATRLEMVRRVLLPMALPGILTGTILSISRAIGETAPLLLVGAVLTSGVPLGIDSKITALPLQIFQWTQHAKDDFQLVAAAAIVVLLVIMLCLNGIAIYLRNRFEAT